MHDKQATVQCFENHGQDSRIKPIEVSDTRNQKDGTGGNNLPLLCFSKVSHPHAPNGEGERWDEREVAQTRNTFDNGEKRCQEVVVSTNSNGVEFFTPGITPECSPTLKHGTGDHRAAVLVNSKAKEGAEGEVL